MLEFPRTLLESIAAQIYLDAIEPGHDLRFYEEVILHVNRIAKRSGVRRVYGDIWLEADRLIWLVSPALAKGLKGQVPSGSFTGGLWAEAKKVWRHFEDIWQSVIDSPQYFLEVAGEYADAIMAHWPEILATVLAFVALEMMAASLAAAPTGVSQLAAMLIQLLIAALAGQALVDAARAALEHAAAWLKQAWTAHGDPARLAEASKSFVRMILSIVIAVLSFLGLRSSGGRAMKLANRIKYDPPGLSMQMATANGAGVVMPQFRPGRITVVGEGVKLGIYPPTAAAMAAQSLPDKTPDNPPQKPSSGTPSGKKLTKEALDDIALEKLLDQLPNWEVIKQFVGTKFPKEGTKEFAELTAALKKAGYELHTLQKGPQPYRLMRQGLQKADDPRAALTVTDDGIIVLKTGNTTRMSVFSRYRKNYLDWVEKESGKLARQAAEKRIALGHQLHHLIPDSVAQNHPLIKAAMERVKGYTIDRGTNIIDMPSAPNAKNLIIHRGSHPHYCTFVVKELNRELQTIADKVSGQVLKDAIFRVEEKLRRAIQEKTLPAEALKELYENGILQGAKLGALDIQTGKEGAYV